MASIRLKTGEAIHALPWPSYHKSGPRLAFQLATAKSGCAQMLGTSLTAKAEGNVNEHTKVTEAVTEDLLMTRVVTSETANKGNSGVLLETFLRQQLKEIAGVTGKTIPVTGEKPSVKLLHGRLRKSRNLPTSPSQQPNSEPFPPSQPPPPPPSVPTSAVHLTTTTTTTTTITATSSILPLYLSISQEFTIPDTFPTTTTTAAAAAAATTAATTLPLKSSSSQEDIQLEEVSLTMEANDEQALEFDTKLACATGTSLATIQALLDSIYLSNMDHIQALTTLPESVSAPPGLPLTSSQVTLEEMLAPSSVNSSPQYHAVTVTMTSSTTSTTSTTTTTSSSSSSSSSTSVPGEREPSIEFPIGRLTSWHGMELGQDQGRHAAASSKGLPAATATTASSSSPTASDFDDYVDPTGQPVNKANQAELAFLPSSRAVTFGTAQAVPHSTTTTTTTTPSVNTTTSSSATTTTSVLLTDDLFLRKIRN